MWSKMATSFNFYLNHRGSANSRVCSYACIWGILALQLWNCSSPGKEPEQTDSVATIQESIPTLGDYSGIGGDFTLRDHNDQPFDLAEHRNKVVLLFFGYTFCPDFCPLTLSKLAQVYGLLGDSSADMLTLFVSVDPQRDTPKALKAYLDYFSIKALGLRGSKAEIDAVIKAYGGQYSYAEQENGAYMVNHSTYTYLIDRTGTIRFLFRHTDSPEKMAGVIRQLLN